MLFVQLATDSQKKHLLSTRLVVCCFVLLVRDQCTQLTHLSCLLRKVRSDYWSAKCGYCVLTYAKIEREDTVSLGR